MTDMEWRMINLEMKEFKYSLSKLTNPYIKEEAKASVFDSIEKKLVKRSKRIKFKD